MSHPLSASRGVAADPRRALLLELYAAGLAAVDGARVVREALTREPLAGPVGVVALGKAAPAMCRGALEALDARVVSGLVVTKRGHGDPRLCADRRLRCLEAAHPVPDGTSLAAGAALRDFLAASPPGLRFLFLVSGGTSALVEELPAGVTAGDLRRLNEWLLGSGLDIHQVNRVRKAVSCIKGGRLAARLRGHPVRVLAISDVPGDDPASIGSGLLVAHGPRDLAVDAPLPPWVRSLVDAAPAPAGPAAYRRIEHRVVADNARARAAVMAAAQGRGLQARDGGPLEGDVLELAPRLARAEEASGVTVWGGEPTVQLPPEPGRGGRCQMLALAAARHLDGSPDRMLLAAGTDGTDGPTADAGALVDGETVRRGALAGLDADAAIARADAGTFLEAAGDLVSTGPTGTNVMDLVLLWAGDSG